MNNSPCIIIQCIFPGNNAIKDQLLVNLNNHIQKQWPNAKLTVEFYSDYPKIDGDKKIVYGVTHSPKIMVQELIRNFQLSWNYRESLVRDVDSQKNYNQESAIWSQLNHPNEIFLIPEIEWVHIYTWED